MCDLINIALNYRGITMTDLIFQVFNVISIYLHKKELQLTHAPEHILILIIITHHEIQKILKSLLNDDRKTSQTRSKL